MDAQGNPGAAIILVFFLLTDHISLPPSSLFVSFFFYFVFFFSLLISHYVQLSFSAAAEKGTQVCAVRAFLLRISLYKTSLFVVLLVSM